jgi:hypothetical protein
MLKKIFMAATAAAAMAMFACSSDDGNDSGNSGKTSSASAGDASSSSSEEAGPQCEVRCTQIWLAFRGTAASGGLTPFGSYGYVYAENGASFENDPDAYGGYKLNDGVKVDGKNAFQLKNFDMTEGDAGIGIETKQPEEGETIKVALDSLRYLQYWHKGVAHQFRLQKEAGVFWMQKVPVATEWVQIIIDVQDVENFVEGEEGLGAYDPSAVTSIQWVPDIDFNTSGTLYISEFYGFAR